MEKEETFNIPDKKGFDLVKLAIHRFENVYFNYPDNEYFSNRYKFLYQHPDKTELDFLKNELLFLEGERERHEKQKKLLLNNIERFYPKDDIFFNEVDYWIKLENAMVLNIGFIKTKVVTEIQLNIKEEEKEPSQKTKTEKENPYPEIFKGNGIEVFEKIHSDYKDKENRTANYSFLFYAMKKDKLIHCSGIDFIRFLASKYNIHIDKIDSRQSGQNKRTDYYNVIKAQ